MFFLQNDIDRHLVYNIITIGCFFVSIILQTAILIETIRPNNNNSEQNQNKPTLKLQKNSRKNVLCTSVIYLNDLGLIAVQIMINFIEIPMFFVLFINIVLYCVTLTFSYGDYTTRIFPFTLLKPDSVFKQRTVLTIC